MPDHRSVTLQLRNDKPDNVYRFVYAWQVEPSGHANDIFYLFLHALVQWGPNRNQPMNAFSIAMQYSAIAGQNVDVSQPPHILEDDLPRVATQFDAFVRSRQGQR